MAQRAATHGAAPRGLQKRRHDVDDALDPGDRCVLVLIASPCAVCADGERQGRPTHVIDYRARFPAGGEFEEVSGATLRQGTCPVFPPLTGWNARFQT